MPVTPSQLRRAHVVPYTHAFASDEGTIEVTFRYDRNKITDAWLRQWNEYEQSHEGHAMNEMLADLLVGWDVVNEDGSPYPITTDALAALFALPDKQALIKGLVQGSVPSDAEGKGSSEPPSTPSEASELLQPTPPNGAAPLPSPEPSASPSPT